MQLSHLFHHLTSQMRQLGATPSNPIAVQEEFVERNRIGARMRFAGMPGVITDIRTQYDLYQKDLVEIPVYDIEVRNPDGKTEDIQIPLPGSAFVHRPFHLCN